MYFSAENFPNIILKEHIHELNDGSSPGSGDPFHNDFIKGWHGHVVPSVRKYFDLPATSLYMSRRRWHICANNTHM